MENKINSLNSLVNTRSKLMASKRIYNAENMFKPYFNYDETKPYDDQKFTPFSSLKYKLFLKNIFVEVFKSFI